MTLFEKMRPLFASSEKRVQYLTNEITFLFNHDFRGKMEYSTHDDAVATVCQNFKIDENALADLNKILSSDGNYQKLKAVSLQDGKEYVIMKGYRSGTLAVYESNKKIPSSEYIEERLNAINDSTCFITAKYAAKFAESKGKAVSEISFNKGVAEISLGTEQLTLDMGGIIYETMNAVVENKYVTWKRADPQNEPATKDGHAQQTEQPAKPIVLTDASLGAIKAIISNRAITMNIKKEYDANLGKGSFDNFANQAVSRLYGIYLKLSQSAQSDGGGGNAFMNAVADLQVRSSIRDMQETSAFTYDIAKKKKEEKDDQDGKTGSGFA